MKLDRIEERIRKIAPRSLRLLCQMPDGAEAEMSVQECIDSNSEFLKVLGGNDLHELDRLFKYEFAKMGIPDIFSRV